MNINNSHNSNHGCGTTGIANIINNSGGTPNYNSSRKPMKNNFLEVD
jgi:hypothetical protein